MSHLSEQVLQRVLEETCFLHRRETQTLCVESVSAWYGHLEEEKGLNGE